MHNHELPKKIECLSYFFFLRKIKYLIINGILLLNSVNRSLKITKGDRDNYPWYSHAMSLVTPVFTAFLNLRKYWCWFRKKVASNKKKKKKALCSSIFWIYIWKRLIFSRGLYVLSRPVLLCWPLIMVTGHNEKSHGGCRSITQWHSLTNIDKAMCCSTSPLIPSVMRKWLHPFCRAEKNGIPEN